MKIFNLGHRQYNKTIAQSPLANKNFINIKLNINKKINHRSENHALYKKNYANKYFLNLMDFCKEHKQDYFLKENLSPKISNL
jgi:hypothetical protein